jgi:glycosyl hydrolase family 8
MEANGMSPRSKDFYDMRSSDFMPDHIRAFRQATGDSTWDSVLDNNYRIFHYLQDTYSPDAGLVPDFIKHIHLDSSLTATPAQANYLESKYDGAYNFNACRVPWRIAADYLVSGDPRAAEFLARINPWIKETTKSNPDNISAGYSLAGDDLSHRNYEALCFICPFAVAAMASPDNQDWLNRLWDYVTNFKMKDFDYYDNSIKMIDLIILSGNYWAPPSPDSDNDDTRRSTHSRSNEAR